MPAMLCSVTERNLLPPRAERRRAALWLFESLYVWYTIHNAGRAGNRGKSKRRLKTTPVLG
jgi:hypothetical protein